MQQQANENQVLRDRMTTYEAIHATASPTNGGGETQAVLQALRGLPEALARMSKPKGLFDPKGLGKPQTLGDDAESKFRLWSVKLEDYVFGVYGGKSREALEWASTSDAEIGEKEIKEAYGEDADLADQWDDIDDFNSQLYSVLRATTEGVAFDVVENAMTGAGLEAWRLLHRRFDPATGSRKRIMLQALTSPERATYENLQSALERWKALRSRYDRKRDQFGTREALPDSLAMNSLERLVPKELEQHLLLNFARFKNFEDMEKEVVNYMEAKTGNKMTISTNFSKASSSNGPVPMDVDSLIQVVSGSISSLAKTKGDGKGGKKGSSNTNKMGKFEGTCDKCGKYGHKKKDCWSKGSSGGKGSKGAGGKPSKEKFKGNCDHCGKPGHKKADCWLLNGKGKGGGKSNGGSPAHKGRSAASLESHPEPEPAAASGLELCALEVDTLTVVHSDEESWDPEAESSRRRSRSRSRRPEVEERTITRRPFNDDASRSRTTSPLNARQREERAEDAELPTEEQVLEAVEGEEEEYQEEEEVELEEEGEPGDAEAVLEEEPWSPSLASVSPDEPNWICCNLDTGASVTVFPKRMFTDLEPVGMRLKTASGEIVQGYGKATIRGEDQQGMVRKLNGNVADVHKVLVSAGQMHEKGYTTWLHQGGGEIIPKGHPVNKALEHAYKQAIIQFGREGIIPVVEEDGIYNFYLKEKVPEEGAISPKSPDEPPPRNQSGNRVTTEVFPVPKRASQRSSSSTTTTYLACGLEPEEVEAWREIMGEEDLGEVQEGVEARWMKPGWQPVVPTEEERRSHEASGHAVFRNWCQECLAATGMSHQHRKVDHSQDKHSTVVMDFFYLTEEEHAKPHLVAQDRKTGMMMATSLEGKGSSDAIAQKLLTKFIELIGWKELTLKSDGEHSLVKIKKKAGKEAQNLHKVIYEESPAGDSRANGEAEAAVKEIKWRIRAITMTLKKKIGGDLPDGHPLLQWIPRYAAEQANRFRVGADGKTPEERRTGKKWIKALPMFGEKVMIKPAGKGKRDDQSRMKAARFLGCHNRFGSILGMTSEGVVVGSSYHVLAEDEKWGPLEENLKGAPWDVRAYVKRKPVEDVGQPQQLALPAPAVVVVQADHGGAEGPGQGERSGEVHEAGGEDEAEADKSPMIGEPSASGQKKLEAGVKRAWPVRREYLNKFGKTAGCPGCDSLLKGIGFQQVTHSNECRQRIKRSLQEEDEKKEAEMKRLKEEDQKVEDKKRKAEEQVDEPIEVEGTGGSSSSAEPSSSGVKRKAEEEPIDVGDLLEEADKDSPADAASVQAMADLLDSWEAARTIAQIAAMDVIEVFSPKRLNLEVARFGLRPGAAIDLDEMKPGGEECWNLDREDDFQKVLDTIALEEPWLVTSSPPCSTFSSLRRLSNYKRDAEVVAEEERLGKKRLKKAMTCCKQQMRQKGYFLHEHPKEASSWDEDCVREVKEHPEVWVVQSPMCRFNMKLPNDAGELLHVRKETCWMTNSEEIAKELQGTCENVLQGREVHRHVHLVGAGRAKAAQVYPKELCEAILRGLKKQMKRDKHISSIEEMIGGPVPDDYVEWEDQVDKFYDDTTGAELDPELIKAARKEELDWLHKERVYVRVPRSECEGPLLKLKWINVNKGDEKNPKIRCRIVAREIKKAKALEDQLGGAETFSATPPIECVYGLLSNFMTKKKGVKKMLASWDISRAHFMGRAARVLHVELPDEDKVYPTDTEPMCGRLERSMYGTQDASKIFQEDYTAWLTSQGAEFSKLCPAVFKFEEKGLVGVVHGDDFLVTGSYESLQWLDKILNTKYMARWESLLGKDVEVQETFFLNRMIRYVPDGADGAARLEIEADARHVDLLVRDFGFDEKTKGCDTPEEKANQADLIQTERQPGLDPKQSSQFRSMVMRLAYLSVDRPDLCHSVRSLASAMKTPKANDWLKLKRVVRYLFRYPYMKRVYKEQYLEDASVVAWSDSDWAGDLKTRRSTTGSVVKFGNHTLLVKGSSQKVVALSSSESEYYGMCRTATLAEFVRGIMEFWGVNLKNTRLKVDSSSAKAMAERRGVGQSRHIQAKFLWLQDKVAEKSLIVEKVKGTINDSDLVTKVQPRATIQAHLERLGFTLAGRKGHKQIT